VTDIKLRPKSAEGGTLPHLRLAQKPPRCYIRLINFWLKASDLSVFCVLAVAQGVCTVVLALAARSSEVLVFYQPDELHAIDAP
jgi:hypothetical protein